MGNIADIVSHKRTIEIVHPATDRNIGLRIHLYSVEDERTKAVRKQITNEKQRLEMRGKGFKADDLEDNMLKLQYAAIENWEWHKNADGEDAEFTFDGWTGGPQPEWNRKNFEAVVTRLTWIGDQITAEFSDTKAFF